MAVKAEEDNCGRGGRGGGISEGEEEARV